MQRIDNLGRITFQVASENGYHDIAKILSDHGQMIKRSVIFADSDVHEYPSVVGETNLTVKKSQVIIFAQRYIITPLCFVICIISFHWQGQFKCTHNLRVRLSRYSNSSEGNEFDEELRMVTAAASGLPDCQSVFLKQPVGHVPHFQLSLCALMCHSQ